MFTSDNPNPKTNSSVQNADEPPPFGSRFLTEESDMWSKNAWDHVPPPEDHLDAITAALDRQKLTPVTPEEQEKYNARPEKFWDQFYGWNENNFFKDRKWLHNEFPELVQAAEADAGPKVIVEVGCGAGNTVFPLLRANSNPFLKLYPCDYSRKAIGVVKATPLYAEPTCGSILASVWNLADPENLPEGVEPHSADIVVLVFVMSAMHPREWSQAVANVHRMLKPGGLVLLRDYGRHDLTQIRFKESRLMDGNLYVRGDGTRVYFFTLDELATLFTGSRFVTENSNTEALTAGSAEAFDPMLGLEPWLVPLASGPSHPLFHVEQLGVDRRLILNRKRQLKMYRVWIQGKFRAIRPAS